MDPARTHGTHPRTQILPRDASAERTPSRSARAEALLTQILPAAIGSGLQAFQKQQSTLATRGAARPSASTSSGSIAILAGTLARSADTAKTGSAIGTASSSLASWAATSLTIASGVLGAAQIAAHWGSSTPAAGATSGAAVGAAIGSFITPGAGTALGAAIGTMVGGLVGSIRSGKHEDQKLRDDVRALLVDVGVLDTSFKLHFPDGSTYDMGKDGGPRDEFGGLRPFEVDTRNPLAKYAVSWLNPIIELLSRGDQKVHSDFVGYFAHAVLSGSQNLDDVRSRVAVILQKFGVSDEQLEQSIQQGIATGRYSRDVGAAYLNGIAERTDPVFSPKALS